MICKTWASSKCGCLGGVSRSLPCCRPAMPLLLHTLDAHGCLCLMRMSYVIRFMRMSYVIRFVGMAAYVVWAWLAMSYGMAAYVVWLPMSYAYALMPMSHAYVLCLCPHGYVVCPHGCLCLMAMWYALMFARFNDDCSPIHQHPHANTYTHMQTLSQAHTHTHTHTDVTLIVFLTA